MNTRLALVRHGVTAWNYAGRVQGRSDLPLAPEGVRQAEATAARLAQEPWDAIYSSPLQRARQTALIIAHRTGHDQVVPDPRLTERNMGEAEGVSDLDLPLLWPGVPWDELPGMEPVGALVARMQSALCEMAARHPGGRLICVAHGSVIGAFLASLLPPDAGPSARPHPRTTSITTVELVGDQFTLISGPDHQHILIDGVEFSGEKGRVSPGDLAALLPDGRPGTASLDAIVWGATAVESARVGDRLVGFARAFTDGVLFGCVDLAVAAPGYEHVRPLLVERLNARYPGVQFTLARTPL